MPNLRLTQAAANNLKPPTSGRREVWDAQLPGFGLRISASGLKTWQAFYRVDGKMVREKLGSLRRSRTCARHANSPARA